jgi:hypothetical protein
MKKLIAISLIATVVTGLTSLVEPNTNKIDKKSQTMEIGGRGNGTGVRGNTM